MRADTSARARFWWRTLRVVACALLGLIAVDLAFDARCDDRASSSSQATAVSDRGQEQGRGDEPRRDFCVPDCFCCSRSVAPGSVLLPPEPARLTPLDAPGTERWPEGVRPVVDHPPLARG